MVRYVLRRVLIAIPMLWGITVITFVIINLAPGDPLVAQMLLAQGGSPAAMPPEYIESLRAEFNLDRPVHERYLLWLKEFLRGNLGVRYGNAQTVAEALSARVPPTLLLMGSAMTLSLFVGVVLGTICALNQYSKFDYGLTFLTMIGISIPEFLVGILLIFGVAVKLQLLPAGGFITAGSEYSILDNLRHLILPVLALSLVYISVFMRYARSSVLEVLHQPYVTTSRAKGLGERVVISGHVLRNALIPLITVAGSTLTNLLAGSVVVESIFNWPGMGSLYLEAVTGRDYATIMALVIVTSCMVLLANLLADIGYAIADPRIRYS